jgi:cell division protein FtsQ
MWDRPELLRAIADLLLGAAAALLLVAALSAAGRLPAFALRELRVEGDAAHVTREQVELIVRRELRGTLFTVDLEAVRGAFEKLPWVRAVEVRRQWPPGIKVILEEHVPLARWSGLGLVNAHGELFEAATERELPEFAGPPGSAAEIAARYEAFSRLLEPLGQRIAQVRVSARRAWVIRLDGGLTIALGRERMEERLARFVALYGRSVGALPRRPAYVDLRYANGFAVRLGGAAFPGAEERSDT